MSRRRGGPRRKVKLADRLPVSDLDLVALYPTKGEGEQAMLRLLQQARDRQRAQPFDPPSRPLATGFTLADDPEFYIDEED